MSYTYKFEIDWKDGAGWLTINNQYIFRDSIKRKLAFHNNLEPNSNSLVFQLSRDFQVGAKNIIDYLLTTDADVEIRVTRTVNGTTYVPYFAGFLSDNYKLAIWHDGVQYIELKVEDGTNKLLKREYNRNLNLTNKQICNTSNFAASLLYSAFQGTTTDTAYVPLDLTSLPNITNTVPVMVLSNYEDKTTFDYLKAVLYEYGYTFFFNAEGKVVIKSYKPIISPEPTTGFFNTSSQRNIVGSVEIEKNRVAYKDVRIKFQTLKTLNNVIVFTDTTGGDSVNKCNIEVLAEHYYPEGADADVNVYSEYKLETGEDILSVGSITLDINKDSQISQVSAVNLYKRCNLKFLNEGASTHNIRKLDIKGSSVICEDAYGETTGNGTYADDKVLKYEAKVIHTKAESDYLANTLKNYYENANIKYKIKSKDLFAIGDVVKIVEEAHSGINTIGQIIEIEDTVNSDIITYTLIGASTIEVNHPLSTEWLNQSPTINNPPSDSITEQDIADAIASSDSTSLQRTAYFAGGKGLIIPLDVYPEGGIQEPSYALAMQLAAKYPNVSTYVVINPYLPAPYSDTALFYGMDSGYPNGYLNNPYYQKWQKYLAVIYEMRKVGIKIILQISSTAYLDRMIRYFKGTYEVDGISPAPLIGFDGVDITSAVPSDMYFYLGNTYSESLNTTLKSITDYAHFKGYYPVFCGGPVAWGPPLQKYLTNKAIDVSVEYMNGKTVSEVAADSTKFTDMLYRAMIDFDAYTGTSFDSTRFKEMSDYYNLLYSTNYGYQITNGGRKYQDAIASTSSATFKLDVGKPIRSVTCRSEGMNIDGYYHYMYGTSFQAKSSMKCDLTVRPASVVSYFGKLPSDIETEYKLLSGSITWQDVIDSASAAEPRTPEVRATSAVSMAELYWEYQTDLGPALKYYEILVSKDHDIENSDPDNGTWWKPINDGTNWRYVDDTTPLQLTTEHYTFLAPLELDASDMPYETTYFFKVRRVAANANSGWGYASAVIRPIKSVEIGKDTISAPMIRANSITADKIAANTITAAHIASVDGGAIKTGNIQSETYVQGASGWKMSLGGSAEFNDVLVRGTVYATDGTFSGSINSGPLILNKNPPSSASKTITSGNSVVTWIRELQSTASITSGSYKCSGSYNGTAIDRLELTQSTEVTEHEYWQNTGTSSEDTQVWGIKGYSPPSVWVDSYGVAHASGGGPIYGWITVTITTESDIKWIRTATKYTYTLKLYNASNTQLLSVSDWYNIPGTWEDSGETAINLDADTASPTDESITQGTTTFAASGLVSFTADSYTYKLVNLPTANTGLPVGTVYQDENGFLRIII